MTSPPVPPLAPGACQVWWAEVGTGHQRLEHLLDPAERERAARFRREGARLRYVLARVMTRVVLGRLLGVDPAGLAFDTTCRHCGGPHGNPTLTAPGQAASPGPGRPARPAGQAARLPGPPVRLSISHSGDLVAVALTRGVEVGIDVEAVTSGGARMPALALSPTERTKLDELPATSRNESFLRYWTRKEAVLKATGYGLGVAPASLTVSPPDEAPALLAWTAEPALTAAVFLVDLAAAPGYVASLATLDEPVRISRHDFTAPPGQAT